MQESTEYCEDFPYKCCPFCGNYPRYLPFKLGFYVETVICDTCEFGLPPEIWERRV